MIKNLPHGFLPIWDPSHDPKCARLGVSLEAFADADASLVLLRSRGLDEEIYRDLAEEAAVLAETLGGKLLLHRHWQHAEYLPGIAGVHLTADSDPIELVRETLGYEMIIGFSAHSVTEAQAATAQGADYILFGPVFPTIKNGVTIPGQGVPALAKLCQDLPIPVYAIGGVVAENLLLVRDAGAHGFGALRAVFETSSDDELAHAVQKLAVLWREWP